jgi:hypothetical protein
MKTSTEQTTAVVDVRPWFREPWVWVIIAFPAAAVVGCAITIWLAITRPDHLVIEEVEYQKVKSELRATPEQAPDRPAQDHGSH